MLKSLVFAAFSLLAAYLYNKLRYKRFRQYADIPQLPPSLLLGHLKLMGEYLARGPADRHPDSVFTQMNDDLGRPPLMFVDFRPVNRPMVLVRSHEIAEQVSRSSKAFPTSTPKSPLPYLEPIIGPTSILASHGEEWKALRKRFSPGFAPQYLMTLLPCILDKTVGFTEHLDSFVKSGDDFSLVPLGVNLAFDIIGAIVMGENLHAQNSNPQKQSELIQIYRELVSAYMDDKADLPWWLIPRTILKRRRLGKRIDVIVKSIIHRNHSVENGNARSILSLALEDTKVLTTQLIDEACDQIKTFLFAGHDTTSTTIAWIFYELSLTPRVLGCVRAELDDILGPETGVAEVRSKLLSPEGPDALRRMKYIAAVIKETLRLHPPAATARTTAHGTGFTVRTPDGQEYCLDGTIIYNCETLIHRDPDVYGDTANSFVPERWIGQDDEQSKKHSDLSSNQIPPSAWRPFERGPRNCIGQEFANIELRVIVAVVARHYDFFKVGLGEIETDNKQLPVATEDGRLKVKSELYNMRQITIKPVDRMRMKVKIAQQQ
ncbi:cytochrome P450 [Daldinia caldariorum]|uniref:cytochrome P450 n=1 Tax=Daldinia caldariorum TaxID=326644 RepID=UPI002008046C|nr:cytochrome P450 [Daldinia caldariorum]KAI1468961.1 cytochrome P450 [Daldinia caldariorum]